MSTDEIYKSDNGRFQIWRRSGMILGLTYAVAGYEDPYPELIIGLLGFMFYFQIPIKVDPSLCDFDPPTYGFELHKVTGEWGFWIHYGGRLPLIYRLPFVNWELKGCYVDVKDRGYVNDKDISEDQYNKKTMPYTDSYDGTVVNITYWKVLRVWHRKWLPFITDQREYVMFDFDKEVGKEKGSWKGGVLGSSYLIKPGETAEECIKRMEREYQF